MRQVSAEAASVPTPSWGGPIGGSSVAVLARGAGGVRPGATVLPLDRRVAHRSGAVGLEVAVTASLTGLLPTPPTAVVVVPSEVDLAGVVDEVRFVACAMLELDSDPLLTVGLACPTPVAPGTAGELCLYNLHPDALTEALLESLATARRANLVTLQGNCVLLVQKFAPAKASAVVYASPDRARPVRISGRWGLTEANLAADEFEVAADGRILQESLALKPTANMTAHGGTHTVDLSEHCRVQRSLSQDSVLRLASLARNAADAVGQPLCIDVGIYDEHPVALRCRPCDTGRL